MHYCQFKTVARCLFGALGIVAVATMLSHSSIAADDVVRQSLSTIDVEPVVLFHRQVSTVDSDEPVYVAELGLSRMYFGPAGVTHVIVERLPETHHDYDIPQLDKIELLDRQLISGKSYKISTVAMSFGGASSETRPSASEPRNSVYNDIRGADPSKWVFGARLFGQVTYQNVYPNIDVRFYSKNGAVKYDFVVKPGGDPNQIRIQYSGINDLSLAPNGALLVKTNGGAITESKPLIYQESNNHIDTIDGRFELVGSDKYKFTLGSQFDPTEVLVIDPILSSSSYIGGTREDWGYRVALDNSFPPNIVVVGHTWSPDFPTGGVDTAHDTTLGGNLDVFVSKFDPTGKVLLYSTYFGGSGDDWGYGLSIDNSNDIYIAGTTSSPDLPKVNAYDSSLGEPFDGFVAKLSGTDSTIIYSTYLGGSDYEVCNDVEVDGSGNAVVTGMSYSTDFPTTNGAYQETNDGYWDAFITSLNGTGNDLIYSTLLGGSQIETSYGLELDGSGNAYITGWTWSSDFDLSGPSFQQSLNGEQDAFVARVSSTGDALQYSTFFGGNGRDYAKDIAIDNGGYAYITGWTYSDSGFPVTGAFDDNFHGVTDGFVAKLSTGSSSIEYCSYLGGNGSDAGYGISIDNSSRAYVCGRTDSPDFPVAGLGMLPFTVRTDAFLTKFDELGSSLAFSTLYGDTILDDSSDDWSYSNAVYDIPAVPGQVVFMTGTTTGHHLPLVFDTSTFGGANDAFLASFYVEDIEFPIAVIDSIAPVSPDSGQMVTFGGHGEHTTLPVSILAYRWTSDIDGTLSDSASFTTSQLSIGTHVISFAVQDSIFAWSPPAYDTVEVKKIVNAPPVAYIDSVIPSPAQLGQVVTFYGHGTDTPDDSITAYSWRSSLMDSLGSDSVVSVSTLIPGSHRVSFRVQDANMSWSNPATFTLDIQSPLEEYWEVSWWFPKDEEFFDFKMNDHYACTLFVTNISQKDQVFDFGLNRSVEDLDWQGNDAGYTWLDSMIGPCVVGGSLNEPNYNYIGTLSDEVKPDETKSYTFTIYNDWTWIPPTIIQDWKLPEFITATAGFIPTKATTVISAPVDAGNMVGTIINFQVAPFSFRYTYSLAGDASQVSRDETIRVYVRPAKVWAYWISAVTSWTGTALCIVGGTLLNAGPPASASAIYYFCGAFVCYIVSKVVYQIAYDPDPNYAVLVQPPNPEDLPSFDAIDSLDESCMKDLDYQLVEMQALASAALGSYGKCIGALQGGSVIWSARQLANSHAYIREYTERLEAISDFTKSFLSAVPLPSSSNLSEIQDSIMLGLPSAAATTLIENGIDTADVTSAVAERLDSSDGLAYARLFSSMADSLLGVVQASQSIGSDLLSKGIQGAVLGEVVQRKPKVLLSGGSELCTLWVEFPGRGVPFTDFTLNSVTVNGSPGAFVDPTMFVANVDNDSIPEIRITYPPDLGTLGSRLQSVDGIFIPLPTSTLDLDTLPFATATLLKVIQAPVQPRLMGCVASAETFDPIAGARVTVYRDSLELFPVDSQITNSLGEFEFAIDDSTYYVRFDASGHEAVLEGPVDVPPHDTLRMCEYLHGPCCSGLRGNIDGDPFDNVDIADLTYLVRFAFKSGPEPPCPEEGDVNGSGGVNIADVTFLVAYMFKSGSDPAPCP